MSITKAGCIDRNCHKLHPGLRYSTLQGNEYQENYLCCLGEKQTIDLRKFSVFLRAKHSFDVEPVRKLFLSLSQSFQ